PGQRVGGREGGGPGRQADQAGEFGRLRPGGQRLDEAARLVDVGEAFDDLVAAQHAEGVEVGAGGRQGVEGVRLLPQLPDGDAHEPSSLGPSRTPRYESRPTGPRIAT